MFYVDDQTRLLNTLFSCAAASEGPEKGQWQPFLARLRDLARADGVSLCLAQGRAQRRSWSVGQAPNVAPEALEPLRFQRVYEQSEVLGEAAESGFLRLIKVRSGPNMQAVLSLFRGAEKSDFRAIDGQSLDLVAGYLAQAVSIWAALEEERSLAALNAQTAQLLGAGWLLIDSGGVITHLSPLAKDLAEEAGLPFATRRRFEPSDPALASAYRAALSACLTHGRPQSVLLSHEPLIEMVLQRDVQSSAGGLRAALRHAPQLRSIDPARLATHFGLTPSEARLAARLCDGQSLRDAAQDLGWTEQTARSCSKAIFARLGVSGQPALVRHILSSGVFLIA
ncbi:hypothetical protein SAMN05877809_10230 [Rhodobacter sp. JA431]|uniref:helix-turn-helix transcriptional regulator n=1 Tax=Rhodobacter sp. JA431 TaxID=570013 RepID=UPI000BD61158|nr:hypothetical protein [Rhodobacter sp. JA431]SOB97756.1 hypothetical protein SAMN05877809_10230 [Rhodobacter sp. JA431]